MPFSDKCEIEFGLNQKFFLLLGVCYNMQLRMMSKSFSFLLATMVAGLLLVGCKEKPVTTPGDLEDPKIVMTSPLELPYGEYISITSTDSFFVDVAFSDDKELRDWEVTIRFMPDMNYLRTNTAAWKETKGDRHGRQNGSKEDLFLCKKPSGLEWPNGNL